MTIKSSKLLIMGYHFIVCVFIVIIFSYFFPSDLSMNYILYLIVIAFLSYLIFVFSNKFDTEVSEDNKFIGGPDQRINRRKSPKFVSKETLDVDRSTKRSIFDYLTGQYKIYNKEGSGFTFNRHYFFKEDFRKII